MEIGKAVVAATKVVADRRYVLDGKDATRSEVFAAVLPLCQDKSEVHAPVAISHGMCISNNAYTLPGADGTPVLTVTQAYDGTSDGFHGANGPHRKMVDVNRAGGQLSSVYCGHHGQQHNGADLVRGHRVVISRGEPQDMEHNIGSVERVDCHLRGVGGIYQSIFRAVIVEMGDEGRFWMAHMFTKGASSDPQRHSGLVEQALAKEIRPEMQQDGVTKEEGSGDGWVYVLYCDAKTLAVLKKHIAEAVKDGKMKKAAAGL